jgi:Protein of unknown function (DUF4238)
MAEKKKQHFVPKLLLRSFASDYDKKLISIFNVDTGFFRLGCPIKNQAQEDFFYGNDGVIEDSLGKIENDTAPIIKSILNNRLLPKRDTKEYGLLFFFSLLLAYRTQNAAEQINEVVNKSLQEIIKLDEGLKDYRDSGLKFGYKNPAAESLKIISESILGAYDLELKLLVNNTKNKFIVSDNPAVKYNQFLEKRKHPGGYLGIYAKGLQLFLPISPDLLLVYFDKWAYKIGNRKDKVVLVNNAKDINTLNYLQIVNCFETVFSQQDNEFYLNQLAEKSRKLRSQDSTIFKEINKRFVDENGNEHIQYMNQGVNKGFNMDLSFIKQPQPAKSHILSDFVVQLRDEKMRYYKR